MGTVMHEIGHALGYIHTQSRVDRNSFVNIVSANLQSEYAANFFLWSFGTIRFLNVDLPYEFASIMHYNPLAFSKNNRPTITALDRRFERTMGQRDQATFYDYKSINRLYCTRPGTGTRVTASENYGCLFEDCPQMFTNNACQNEGYLDPRTCLRCICPDGFGGLLCDQRDATSTCGDTITNPTPTSPVQFTIQNPLPTSTTPTLQYCVYHIRVTG